MIFLKMQEQKGFTLIELLIVIAILGLLAAAAAPKFLSYKEQANANTCKNNQATIETALEQLMSTGDYSAYSEITSANLYGTNAPLKTEPKCPSGGDYSWDTEGVVSCSITSGNYPHTRS